MRNKLRLATWIVCLLAIMVSFACVITAANNIVENNAKVIFISGTGDDANSGLSPKQAVRHLQKATELLNGAGGTIVFSGDVLENTGITIPAQKSKVIFTSIYNGKNYSSTLSFGSAQNQANKNLVFSSEAEINGLHINYNLKSSAGKKLLTIYSGPSMRMETLIFYIHLLRFVEEIRNRWYRILRLWYIPVHISILSLETALTR